MVLELLEGEKETPALLLSPLCEDMVGRQLCASQEWAPNGNQISWHLELGLPASRTARNNCLVFEPPVCGIPSWQPELIETLHREPRGCKVTPGAGVAVVCCQIKCQKCQENPPI